MKQPEGPYKVYDVMTNAFLGGYLTDTAARISNKGKPITVIYRPGRKRIKR